MQALSNELLIPLCIEQKKQPSKLTNEKDEFNDRSKSQRNRKKEKGKGKENLVRCDGAGLCEAGKSLFSSFSLRQERNGKMGVISSCYYYWFN